MGQFATNGNVSNGTSHPSYAVEVPVLIVGGGPTGLLSAYMLSKLGVKSLLIEKYPERLAAPKAHALCPRSLEICRQFGLDTNAMRKLGSPRDDAYWVNFLTNLSGERIGVLPYERMDVEVLNDTPEMIHNIPQPDFEEFLAHNLLHDPNVEVRKGVAFVSCEQTGDYVYSTVEERFTKVQWNVRSRYVLACDGAKSQARKFLGIESEGEDSYETMMTIHFKADLRPVIKDRVGILHWITDPACSGFIIGYDLGGNQVLISNFDSKKHPAETWTEDLARDVVGTAIGQEIPFDVLSYRPWILSRKVAKQYRQGNVFLVGDAAHSFPPTGGLGLNSGIADAHNIVIKVAAVLQAWASDALFDGYEADRRQIALVNSAQSVKNGKQIFSFLKTLGTADIDDIAEARANLYKSIHDPDKQKMINREIEGQREHFDNLEIHIGYVYGDKRSPLNASKYTPKFVSGARLPHAWLRFPDGKVPSDDNHFAEAPIDVSYVKELSPDQILARQYSTLDLCGFSTFTIMASSRSEWLDRFEEANRVLKQPLSQKAILKLWGADEDFYFIDEAQRALFNQNANFAEGGALLIRPDQHILRCLGPSTSGEEIANVVLGYLAL